MSKSPTLNATKKKPKEATSHTLGLGSDKCSTDQKRILAEYLTGLSARLGQFMNQQMAGLEGDGTPSTSEEDSPPRSPEPKLESKKRKSVGGSPAAKYAAERMRQYAQEQGQNGPDGMDVKNVKLEQVKEESNTEIESPRPSKVIRGANGLREPHKAAIRKLIDNDKDISVPQIRDQLKQEFEGFDATENKDGIKCYAQEYFAGAFSS